MDVSVFNCSLPSYFSIRKNYRIMGNIKILLKLSYCILTILNKVNLNKADKFIVLY